MSKECLTRCPGGPCALLQAAEAVPESAAVAQMEEALLREDIVLADANVMEAALNLDLRVAAGEAVDVNRSGVTAAFDQGHKADSQYYTHTRDNGALLSQGQGWVVSAKTTAADAMSECSGPIHGIRIPLVDVVVSTPDFIGTDHCGAPQRELTEFVLRMGANLGIVRPGAEG